MKTPVLVTALCLVSAGVLSAQSATTSLVIASVTDAKSGQPIADADVKVAVDSDSVTAKALATEPCRRQMTVQDLLRHTSGFTYAHLTGPLLKQAYESANVGDDKHTNAEMAARLATIPLAYQPGSTWQYGMSTDVLGRVVEAASGMNLDRFIIECICKPLGLKDSSFGPIAYARAAQPQVDPATGKRPPMRAAS
jgi:CubicO group peptidase (beta-lactamase class C family)